MNWNRIALIGSIIASLILGFMIGRSFDTMNAALRKAQELSRRGIEDKKKAVEILLGQMELADLAVRNAKNEREAQIIALALSEKLIQYEMWNDALKYLDIAKNILPGNYYINYNLGLVYYNLQNIEKSPMKKALYSKEAGRYLELAVQINPDSVDPYYLLGMMRYQTRLYDDAEAYFKQISERFPDEPRTLFALARIYFDRGEFEKARKIYLKLQTILPKDSRELMRTERNLSIIEKAIQKEQQ